VLRRLYFQVVFWVAVFKARARVYMYLLFRMHFIKDNLSPKLIYELLAIYFFATHKALALVIQKTLEACVLVQCCCLAYLTWIGSHCMPKDFHFFI
jgi:hypothetical protein